MSKVSSLLAQSPFFPIINFYEAKFEKFNRRGIFIQDQRTEFVVRRCIPFSRKGAYTRTHWTNKVYNAYAPSAMYRSRISRAALSYTKAKLFTERTNLECVPLLWYKFAFYNVRFYRRHIRTRKTNVSVRSVVLWWGVEGEIFMTATNNAAVIVLLPMSVK